MASTKARHVFSHRSVRLNRKGLLCKKKLVPKLFARPSTIHLKLPYPSMAILQFNFLNFFRQQFSIFPTSLSPLYHQLVDGCQVTDLEGSHTYPHDSLCEHSRSYHTQSLFFYTIFSKELPVLLFFGTNYILFANRSLM